MKKDNTRIPKGIIKVPTISITARLGSDSAAGAGLDTGESIVAGTALPSNGTETVLGPAVVSLAVTSCTMAEGTARVEACTDPK